MSLRGALLLLLVVALWGLAHQTPTAAIAGSSTTPGSSPSLQGPSSGESQGVEPQSAEPLEEQESVQPPGREDPNRFYRKPPRKPRELRQVKV